MDSIRNKPHEEMRSRNLPIGIQARLFMLIALVLLPLSVLLAWTNYQRYDARRLNELRTETEVAQGIATAFEIYVEGVRQQLFTTAQAMHRLTPFTLAQATQLLTSTAHHFPTIRHLSWVSREGTVLASSLPAAVGRSIAHRLYFQDILSGRPWGLSNLFRGTLTNAPIFTIAVGARDDAGALEGVVVAGVGPEELGELTLSLNRPFQGALALFDAQGTLVHFSPDETLTWEDRVNWRDSDPLLQRALATGGAQTGLMSPASLDGEWLSARVPINRLGWVAGAGRPTEIAFAPLRRSTIRDLSLALLITSGAFLLAFLFARTIATPLRRLEADARTMGTGEIPPARDRSAPREVQSLRDTVATMAGSLVAAKQGAEAASRAKSEFLANMSHELRTPMTVIMGSLEFLQQSASTPEQRQLLDLASTSSDRLLGIIDDLLDISRIEAGRLKIEERPFDLRECVRQAVAIFTGKGDEKGVRVHWEVPSQIPSHVHGDPDRLGQVLINLVGNAVKFTERGEVAVTVSQVGNALEFSVRDTGIGIPSDQIERLFQPFTQVDSSLTRRFGGTGLGLAISRELVTLMGGAIRLESEEGKGSTFTFTLPLRPAEEVGKPSRRDISPRRAERPLHFLLAEDDPMVRELVAKTLARRGVNVIFAKNGEEAVAKWNEGGVDLILMDLQMPEVDGLEATRRIRNLEGEQGVKRTCIFALTAHARSEDREQCLEAGMDGFLAKPLQMEELDSLIEKCPCGRH